MLLSNVRALGLEVVIEYSPTMPWSNYGFVIEDNGSDAYLFLGKVSCIYSNHWRANRGFGRRVISAVTSVLLTVGALTKAGFTLSLSQFQR